MASPRGTPTWRGGGRGEAMDEGGNRWERELTVAVWFHPWTYELCKPWPVHTLGAESRSSDAQILLFGSFYFLFVLIRLSLYTLHTQTVYFDRFNVKCFVLVGFFTFTRAGFLSRHSALSLQWVLGAFLVCLVFLRWMQKLCFDFFNLQRVKLWIIKVKCE